MEGEVENIQTASSALGTVVNTRSMEALPLSTRNFTNLLAMTAGANAGVANSTTLGKSATGIALNGADIGQNTYLQDGVAVNTWASTNTTQEGTNSGAFPTPNPDTIEEFKIQTSNYDAGYGRNPGANVNVITKSGTTQCRRWIEAGAEPKPIRRDVWRPGEEGQALFLRGLSRDGGEERHRRVWLLGGELVSDSEYAAWELPAFSHPRVPVRFDSSSFCPVIGYHCFPGGHGHSKY
ncbi:MAG: hypothetical protein DMG31_18300 [Acidobacteria bacterium]|nr:MAG: hypothetical protein DMG31_18300 [Acidobacteriota bacterium]